jgi:hypothetical protein
VGMERAPPAPFLCPINQDVMEAPVVGPDGWSYDRAAIEQALQHNPISPMTRQPMSVASLTPNYALRDAIEAWRREQPMAIDSDRLSLDDPEHVIARGAFGKVSGHFLCVVVLVGSESDHWSTSPQLALAALCIATHLTATYGNLHTSGVDSPLRALAHTWTRYRAGGAR